MAAADAPRIVRPQSRRVKLTDGSGPLEAGPHVPHAFGPQLLQEPPELFKTWSDLSIANSPSSDNRAWTHIKATFFITRSFEGSWRLDLNIFREAQFEVLAVHLPKCQIAVLRRTVICVSEKAIIYALIFED
jgi:hypothetical protein